MYSGARRDKDGYIWVTGRIDDMLNVSGHLLSTAQVSISFRMEYWTFSPGCISTSCMTFKKILV